MSEYKDRIVAVLGLIGYPIYSRGGLYLFEASEMVLNEPELIDKLTKSVYPSIAHRYKVSAGSVGQAMLRTTKTVWERWGYADGAPTNRALIDFVTKRAQSDYFQTADYDYGTVSAVSVFGA